jgi:hypothetical protein
VTFWMVTYVHQVESRCRLNPVTAFCWPSHQSNCCSGRSNRPLGAERARDVQLWSVGCCDQSSPNIWGIERNQRRASLHRLGEMFWSFRAHLVVSCDGLSVEPAG